MKNLILSLCLVALVGCGFGGIGIDGKFYTHRMEVKDLINAVNNYVGSNVVVLAKTHTWKWNWAVVKNNNDGKYYAVNLKDYRGGMRGTIFEDWLSDSLNTGNIVEVTPTGSNHRFVAADGTIFEETNGKLKDLEKAGSIAEGMKKSNIAKQLSADFGLSENRSSEIANFIVNWSHVSNSRSMTKRDSVIFANEVFGVDFNTMKMALKDKFEGEGDEYERVLNIAAQKNNISPEQLHNLIEDFINK